MAFAGPDFYGECHDDPINAMPFFVEGPGSSREIQTVANGNVTFRYLLGGTYAVRGGPPRDLVRNAISCALASTPGTPYPFTQVSNFEITLDLVAGQDVICDWFSVPHNLGTDAAPSSAWIPPSVSQTLTVTGMVCPEGYVGNAFASDCASVPAAGALLSLTDVGGRTRLPNGGDFATADADGVVTFALAALVPGSISLHAIIPEGVAVAGGFTVPLVSCTAGESNDVLDVQPIASPAVGQIVRVAIGVGDDVHCDVYFLPLRS